MMQHPWWVSLLRALVTVAIVTLLMKRILQAQQKRWSDEETGVVRHQPWVLITGLAGAILFFGLAIFSNTWGKNATTSIWSTLAFVGFGSLSLSFIADYFFARHRVTEKGIDYGGMFGRRGSMDWSEVKQVSFSPNKGWFVLESQSGAKARISLLLSGLKEFARLTLEHVPHEKIAPEARIMLRQYENEGLGVFVDPDSEVWQQALSKAQGSIPTLRELQPSAKESILVKYAIASSTGEIEHVWGELQQLDENSFRATLETPMLSGDPTPDTPFELPISAIEDWVIRQPDGSIRGGFTTQAEIQIARQQGIPLPDHIAEMEGRFCDR
jgi:hypothetical protein